ncbi:hypothetical protein [Paenibacillus elgii]|uniref:hypothetical protein n=1 Tax=Paenibacillus elgii TaxID=189691 RepID=UPI000248DEE7|nr:hypothetical protein [Paenibacillus elgii]
MTKFLVGLAVFIAVCALLTWGASVLISYIFGIDFGFWKTAALFVLLALVGGFFRG